MRQSDPEDDFILTISDNDDALPVEIDELDSVPAVSPKKLQNGSKRKRSNEPATNGTNMAAKKGKKRKTVVDEDLDLELREDTWTARGEDDGAIDSDFEFQIGDTGAGITEDFDVWNVEAEDQVASARTSKKGVDIDELIARRWKGSREEDLRQEHSGGSVGSSEEPDHEAMGDTLSGQADFSTSPADSETEDETLAADGFGMGAVGEDEEDQEKPLNGDDHDSSQASADDSTAEPVPHPDDEASSTASDFDEDDAEEQARRKAFFAEEEHPKAIPNALTANSFQSMSLSRPILRGLASCSFTAPTPIQSKTIPVALLGRDLVGGAVTGSGKTAAFIIPILERLLYRPKRIPTSRVTILMPTRELAVQCFNVAKKLASYTDITFCQLVGGLSLREQEAVLRTRPDIIIATPGRFIDHMRNSPSFTLETLEILVLDEADRMLEDGFADELNEILTTIPRSRQTMLFSATMTTRVESLIRLGLNRPVRLVINPQKTTVGTLTQEFVRLRPGREEKRLAYLVHLCQTVYTSSTIIFFRQKALAHRVRILFSLLDLKAAELHGSMTQEQRLAALTSFRTGAANFLLATDVASRGLDIPAVSTVINYTAPQNATIYLHRVGRTARAGRPGRACTLAAEPDRKVVKEIVKAARSQHAKVVSRAIDAVAVDTVDALHTRIAEHLEAEIDAILGEEKEERAMQNAEMQVRKGENLMVHEAEIHSRPKRTWFESEREKKVAKMKG
ncbi:MAG: hypothetical protein Q9191_003717, partial [Dirinaria sp. TL-2023a]